MPAPDEAPLHPPGLRLHGLLFLATCATTFFAGALTSLDPLVLSLVPGLLYMVSIMGILLVHEMGHFLAARSHRVEASLPYFIPAPFPPIGTFGAVIRMRAPIRSRTSLVDIGTAGPLAGVAVAVAVCYAGLLMSEVRPLSEVPGYALMEGNSLLYLALKKLAHPEMGPAEDVLLHPVAWAGWLGLLVTSLNLLPAGQLDGGHVLYALTGPKWHGRISRAVHALVFLLGMAGLVCHLSLQHGPTVSALQEAGLLDAVLRGTGMLPWLLWVVLLRFVGRAHPPVEDPGSPLGTTRKAAGLLSLAVLVLTYTPVFGSLNAL